MNDDVQAIIGIVVLLVFLGFLLVPFGLFFVYVFFQNSKRKRIREKIQASQQQIVGQNLIPVRYASEPRFKAFFKIFPWEGAGVLVHSPGAVTFMGETNSGMPVNVQFVPGQAQIKWLGKCPWPNGAVSWFVCEKGVEKHYFTSETGPFVFGSNNSTKAAYDAAQNSMTVS